MDTKTCQICEKPFPCGASTGKCWCMNMPVAPPLPPDVTDCVCQACLKKVSEAEKTPAPLVENLDYYFEKGYMVFTAHYLLKRGYCCNNQCRHCPYK